MGMHAPPVTLAPNATGEGPVSRLEAYPAESDTGKAPRRPARWRAHRSSSLFPPPSPTPVRASPIPGRARTPKEQVTIGFRNTAAALPSPYMAIVEPRLHMRLPLEVTWPRAFVALAGCLECYVAGRGFVPDLLR